jgi:uncharacterized lipoprotein YddW (UPF0748 family)
MLRRCLAALGAAAALALLLAAGPAAQEAYAPDGETRGLWVLRTSLTSPASIQAAVRAAETGGFNALLVQVRGRGEAYYQSAIDPRASDLDRQPVSFDPLALTLELAHRAGVRVHAWVNVDLVSSAATLPRSRRHIVFRRPEWLMVPKALAPALRGVDVRSPAYVGQLARWTRGASATVEGLYLSPIPSASQAYTVAVLEELVSKYPVDGIHLDYARYPGDAFDYSAGALAEFRKTKIGDVDSRDRQQLDAAAAKDPAAWAAKFPTAWAAFRRDRLTSLVQQVAGAAKAARPNVVVSAAVNPDPDRARQHHFQDWGAWASLGLLDVVCPMAYSTNVSTFSTAVSGVRHAVGGIPVWAGIGAWQLPVNRTAEHVRAARRAGAAGVLLFSYDALAASAASSPSGAYFTGLRQLLLGTEPRVP